MSRKILLGGPAAACLLMTAACGGGDDRAAEEAAATAATAEAGGTAQEIRGVDPAVTPGDAQGPTSTAPVNTPETQAKDDPVDRTGAEPAGTDEPATRR